MKHKEERPSLLQRLMGRVPLTLKIYGAIAVVVVALVAALATCVGRHTEVAVSTEERLTLSPTQIESIKRIGQWEFLSVHDEELVDTTRKGFFSDDHLARIYYGTLRLGIDLTEAPEGWITARGDSIVAELPAIELLDENFIDEALTKTFMEEGTWDAKTYNRLYQRAAAEMKRRALSQANTESARSNAQRQFETLLHSLGFERVKVTVAASASDAKKKTKK